MFGCVVLLILGSVPHYLSGSHFVVTLGDRMISPCVYHPLAVGPSMTLGSNVASKVGAKASTKMKWTFITLVQVSQMPAFKTL